MKGNKTYKGKKVRKHIGMSMEHHAYKQYLCDQDPMAEQPDSITIPLKPHQRVALQKAMWMEQHGVVNYDFNAIYYLRRNTPLRGKLQVKSNVGILGDIVGYGKTLTALSIIAATPLDKIHYDKQNIYSFQGRNIAKFTAICERPETTEPSKFIRSTLVIVPRGPVFVQWEQAIRSQTKMKALVLDSLPHIRKYCPPPGATTQQLKECFERYDIVLLKSTSLKSLMDYYTVPFQEHPVVAWERVMIDEAHELLNKIPCFEFKFIWFISGTYDMLTSTIFGGRNALASTLRDIVTDEKIPFMLLRGEKDFVHRSFAVPAMHEHYYLCKLPASFSVVQPYLNPNVLERINANDVSGAIREMGGSMETENDIIELVSRDMQRDLRNKELELQYVESLEIPQEQKQHRITNLQTEIARIHERMNSLRERVTALSTKTCSICYDNYNNPVLLPCTHVFCGTCLIQWMRTGHGKQCPECRYPIRCERLISIVDDAQSRGVPSNTHTVDHVLSKEDMLIKIIKDKPQGKFLVFSKVDNTFFSLTKRLQNEGITHAEIKGSTGQMMRILDHFKNGELRVILLNTYHAGSGIDISFATDVIIFHSMASDKIQAVGRAQRVGRTEPLHVHNLCYPHEMQ